MTRTRTIPGHSRGHFHSHSHLRRTSTPLAALAVLTLWLAACGGSDSGAADPTTTDAGVSSSTPDVADDPADDADAPTTEPADTSGTDATSETEANTSTDEPVATDASSTSGAPDGSTEESELMTGNEDSELEIDGGEAAAIQLTPELTAFADENRQLLEDWSDQLEEFGDQAVDHLGDVSAAPASPELHDLSDQVVDAIGAETTDPGLVAARDFASTVSEALTLSANGDQDSALTVFFALQEQRDTLSATLDQFGL